MPFARKVWQPIFASMPRSAAQRRIMRYASIRCIALSGQHAPCGRRSSERAGFCRRCGCRQRRYTHRGMLPDYDAPASRAACRLFMEAHPPTFSLWVIILDPHRNDGTDARESECPNVKLLLRPTGDCKCLASIRRRQAKRPPCSASSGRRRSVPALPNFEEAKRGCFAYLAFRAVKIGARNLRCRAESSCPFGFGAKSAPRPALNLTAFRPVPFPF
jgi:hypothetical protein